MDVGVCFQRVFLYGGAKMFNLIWKLVCLVALVSILCLVLTGRVVYKDVEESAIEIKDKIGAKVIDPINKSYLSKDNGESVDAKSVGKNH